MEKGIIKYIIAAIAVFAIVFLSQQPALKKLGAGPFFKINGYVGSVWQKTENWLGLKIGTEVQKRGAEVKTELEKQKNNIAQSVWDKIKNYFAEKFSKIFGTTVK